jgi:hypothetical protein
MSEQGLPGTDTPLEPCLALSCKRSISSELSIVTRAGDVLQLLAHDVWPVKRNGRGHGKAPAQSGKRSLECVTSLITSRHAAAPHTAAAPSCGNAFARYSPMIPKASNCAPEKMATIDARNANPGTARPKTANPNPITLKAGSGLPDAHFRALQRTVRSVLYPQQVAGAGFLTRRPC